MRGFRHLLQAIAFAACAVLLPGQSEAQDLAAFYKGRQINMYIGSAVGGVLNVILKRDFVGADGAGAGAL